MFVLAIRNAYGRSVKLSSENPLDWELMRALLHSYRWNLAYPSADMMAISA